MVLQRSSTVVVLARTEEMQKLHTTTHRSVLLSQPAFGILSNHDSTFIMPRRYESFHDFMTSIITVLVEDDGTCYTCVPSLQDDNNPLILGLVLSSPNVRLRP